MTNEQIVMIALAVIAVCGYAASALYRRAYLITLEGLKESGEVVQEYTGVLEDTLPVLKYAMESIQSLHENNNALRLRCSELEGALNFPNLDAMTDDDLEEARTALHYANGYATCACLARKLRKTGEIELAKMHEATASNFYQGLPQKYRW